MITKAKLILGAKAAAIAFMGAVFGANSSVIVEILSGLFGF